MSKKPALDDRFPLLEVRGLKKHFEVAAEGFFEPPRKVRAVDGVSLAVYPGDCFGLVGESGCGKTTLGRAILMLDPPSEGEVLFEGRTISGLSQGSLREVRKDIQVIFQDPFSSLNPRMTVEQIVGEPMIIHGTAPSKEGRRRKVGQLLEKVGLRKSQMGRFPHEFSGGQRQRIGIARALALQPKLIIADEPVSALDVSIQAQILNLLKDLQEEFKLTYVFVGHDFSVVRHLCNKVAVMYLGRIVESAQTETLFASPQHPYTEALLSAVPVPDPEIKRKRILLEGDLPSPLDPPPGCHFHPRCRFAEAACKVEDPPLDEVGEHHFSACPIRPFKDQPSVAALPDKAAK